MVRHGETAWSQEGRMAGWTDLPLTAKGQEQARTLGLWLQQEPFDAVFSSDLQRAVHTARLAYGEPIADARLREINFGDLEGLTWNDLNPEQQAQMLDYSHFAAPGGESVAQVSQRYLSFYQDLSPGKYLCFVHGGPIRGVLRNLGQERLVAPCTVVAFNYSQARLLFVRELQETHAS